MTCKQLKKAYRTTAVFLVILVFCFALLLSLFAADVACEKSARAYPAYAKEDITQLLQKESWTAEDYDKIYHQTGLGKAGIDAVKTECGAGYVDFALTFQEALFYRVGSAHEIVGFTTKRDCTDYLRAPFVPIEAGDVIVSASSHSFGWRNGHAALVLDSYGTVLESLSLGSPSAINTDDTGWFAECTNFIVLRLKDANKEKRGAIARAAEKNLVDVPYSVAVGIFGKKDQGTSPKKTQCAHLVWQAYKNAGYDIDANGGRLVVPRDIARSPLFEVVQVYGFDPDKLW